MNMENCLKTRCKRRDLKMYLVYIKDGESIWLVIRPQINFKFNICLRSGRVGRPST